MKNPKIGLDIRGKSISVGITEDDFIHRRFLLTHLKTLGFDVLWEAENGQEFIEHFLRQPPSICLMDLHMPEIDGARSLRALGEHASESIFIGVTSDQSTEAMNEFLVSGVKDFVPKPFTMSILEKKLKPLTRLVNLKLYPEDFPL